MRDPKDHWPCHDCDAREGQLHQLGCDMECCPKCGGQLISCGCYDLGYDLESSPPPENKRRPYIQWPNLCAYCGELWPKMFKVSDTAWTRYIDPDMRDKIVCRSCWTFIMKRVIDEAGAKAIKSKK